jgi:hypothetical protein
VKEGRKIIYRELGAGNSRCPRGSGTRSAVARHRAAQHGVRSITLRFVLTRISKY